MVEVIPFTEHPRTWQELKRQVVSEGEVSLKMHNDGTSGDRHKAYMPVYPTRQDFKEKFSHDKTKVEFSLYPRQLRQQKNTRSDMDEDRKTFENKINMDAEAVNNEVELRTRDLLRLKDEKQEAQEVEENRHVPHAFFYFLCPHHAHLTSP